MRRHWCLYCWPWLFGCWKRTSLDDGKSRDGVDDGEKVQRYWENSPRMTRSDCETSERKWWKWSALSETSSLWTNRFESWMKLNSCMCSLLHSWRARISIHNCREGRKYEQWYCLFWIDHWSSGPKSRRRIRAIPEHRTCLPWSASRFRSSESRLVSLSLPTDATNSVPHRRARWLLFVTRENLDCNKAINQNGCLSTCLYPFLINLSDHQG